MQFNYILIVEDQDLANLSLRITLESLELPRPMHIYHTGHALSLLKKALSENQPFDLLITDLRMKGLRMVGVIEADLLLLRRFPVSVAPAAVVFRRSLKFEVFF